MEEKDEALTREELSQAIAHKIKICKKYAMKATKKATEGDIADAFSMYNIARIARHTAYQEQAQLIRMTDGKLSYEEIKLLVEVVTLDIDKAYLAIKKAQHSGYACLDE
ncbi:hypothetical protein [Fannyhessea vaginae]|uniref:hypothetical protein n=1 Tax=Fannyhessea vaginae TaxID=82135 RepID=UPI002888FF5B|nr:hypothetical protein [Fannyhessea vaginae]